MIDQLVGRIAELQARVARLETHGTTPPSTDGTLAGDSDAAVPTEAAVKAYADARSPAPGCAFLAYNSADDLNVTGDGTYVTVDFDTEVFDVGSNFASDTFTAPATGTYLFTTMIRVGGITTHSYHDMSLYTSNRSYSASTVNAANVAIGGIIIMGQSFVTDMDAGDTAYVRYGASGGTKVVDIIGSQSTFFSGYRIA